MHRAVNKLKGDIWDLPSHSSHTSTSHAQDEQLPDEYIQLNTPHHSPGQHKRQTAVSKRSTQSNEPRTKHSQNGGQMRLTHSGQKAMSPEEVQELYGGFPEMDFMQRDQTDVSKVKRNIFRLPPTRNNMTLIEDYTDIPQSDVETIPNIKPPLRGQNNMNESNPKHSQNGGQMRLTHSGQKAMSQEEVQELYGGFPEMDLTKMEQTAVSKVKRNIFQLPPTRNNMTLIEDYPDAPEKPRYYHSENRRLTRPGKGHIQQQQNKQHIKQRPQQQKLLQKSTAENDKNPMKESDYDKDIDSTNSLSCASSTHGDDAMQERRAIPRTKKANCGCFG